MIYIYDILVNFNYGRPYEFYEWYDTDEIINIKKIKLVRIGEKELDDILSNNLIVEEEFLIKIYGSCELYNKNKNKLYNYTCLFSDGNRVVAIKFNNEGKIIGRSKLLLDEETEISVLALNLDKYDLKYQKCEKIENIKFYTRRELSIYNYLQIEIKSIYDKKEYSKLKYLYQEYFDKDNISNKEMCNELLDSLNDINNKHKEIYNLLIQTKKQV